MHINYLNQFWYAVAFSEQLGDDPISVELLGIPYVVARLNQQLVAFVDRCPHRGVPLSKGKVCQNQLTCAYHGWRFDAQGHNCQIPGQLTVQKKAQLKRIGAIEQQGILWLCPNINSEHQPPLILFPHDWQTVQLQLPISAGLTTTLEHFLELTHHIEQNTSLRQQIHVEQQAHPLGFSTRYHFGALEQQGLFTLLADATDNLTSHFHLGSIVQIQVASGEQVSAHFWLAVLPIDHNNSLLLVRAAMPEIAEPARLRALLFRLLRRDQLFLADVHSAQQRFNEQPLMAEADVVLPQLLRCLHAEPALPSLQRTIRL